MRQVTDDTITGLLLSDLKLVVEYFFHDQVEIIKGAGAEDAPGIDKILDQISVGMVGYGGVEIVHYKTILEQAMQGVRRAEKFVEHMASEIERWAVEHSDFLIALIDGPLSNKGFQTDVDRVRNLAELLEKKQDAFPPLLLAVYALGQGWDKIHGMA